MPNGTGRYVRVFTQDRALPEIEDDILRAIGKGAQVLMSTADGLSAIDTGLDSRNAAIAAWAEGLSREHGLDWRRVGRDVLFMIVR